MDPPASVVNCDPRRVRTIDIKQTAHSSDFQAAVNLHFLHGMANFLVDCIWSWHRVDTAAPTTDCFEISLASASPVEVTIGAT